MSARSPLLLVLWLLVACGSAPAVTWQPAPGLPHAPPLDPAAIADDWSDEDEDAHPTLVELRETAVEVDALVESAWVKELVRGAGKLPDVGIRTVRHDADKTRYLTEGEFQALSEAEREGLVALSVDSELFYQTKYGSPLAYARPLDLVAAAGMPRPSGKAIFDFGYGTIGHLRLLAGVGARVTAVDVDPFLRALYANPGDQGAFGSGSVRLLHGAFPSDASITKAVGTGYTLFLSKNVLKRGYIHPEQEVPEKQKIDLGVSDEVFVGHLARIVNSGGFVMIYNITPPPNGPGQEYRTWADGRCPFPKGLWTAAGFDVLAFDQDDSAAVRAQGRALRWDADVDLDKEIFATYTLLRRK